MDDEEELKDDGFKMGGGADDDLDEPIDMPDEIPEIEDDPEDRYH